ncbi:MAG: class I SAM-dependent methyltransferase [Pseudohongiellaceae bacterium]
MRKVRDVFDEWAESGKDLGMETGHADAVEEMLEFSLKERSEIGEQFSFLDLGCGNGWATRNVYREPLCNRAVGVDGANKMIINARSRGLGEHYVHADLATYDPKETFDLIHSMEFVYYLADPEELIYRIVNSWLNEGGRLIFGLDFYFENTESHTWPKKLNIPMFMLKETEWINLFKATGLKEVTSWRANETTDWAGTLVITGNN